MDYRLKKQKAIEKVFVGGKTLFAYPIKVAYLHVANGGEDGDQAAFQYAVTVPKRNFKNAVDRNLLKRRMRESVRIKVSVEGKAPPLMAVYIYIAKDTESFAVIDRAMSILMKKLSRIKT